MKQQKSTNHKQAEPKAISDPESTITGSQTHTKRRGMQGYILPA